MRRQQKQLGVAASGGRKKPDEKVDILKKDIVYLWLGSQVRNNASFRKWNGPIAAHVFEVKLFHQKDLYSSKRKEWV